MNPSSQHRVGPTRAGSSSARRPWRLAWSLGLLWLLATSADAETLTLAQCLRETAEHNPSIIQQQYAIQRATSDRLIFRARALPTFGVAGIIGELQQEIPGARIPFRNPATGKIAYFITPNSAQTTFIVLGAETLYEPLFDAAIPASFRRGTVGILAAQENFYAVASTQLHLARTLFLQALFQQQSSAILQDIDRLLAANIQSVNQLAGAGLLGRSSLLTAQVQRENFNPGILSNTGTFHTTLAQLLQVMGRESAPGGPNPLTQITLAGNLGERLPAFDPAQARQRALDRRPDVRALRALVRAYTEDANIARAGYYPAIRVYLDGEAIPQSNVRNNNPNAVRASDQVNVTEVRPGVSGGWNVIDTGAVRGAVRQQEATRDQISIALATLERNIPSELAIVRARVADAESTVAALSGSVDVAQSTLDIIQAGVTQGINSQLELIDARQGVSGIRNGLLAANLELSLAHAEFDRITGNYLQFVNDQPKPPAKK